MLSLFCISGMDFYVCLYIILQIYELFLRVYLLRLIFLSFFVACVALALLYLIIDVPYGSATEGEADDDVYPCVEAIALDTAPHLDHALSATSTIAHQC